MAKSDHPPSLPLSLSTLTRKNTSWPFQPENVSSTEAGPGFTADVSSALAPAAHASALNGA